MQFIAIDAWPPQTSADYRPDLESGNVLFFPKTPFLLGEESQAFLRNVNFAGGAVHKNVAYRPASDRLTGVESDAPYKERLRNILREYSHNVVQFARDLLPQYAAEWKLDYASFRPLEEEGRNLPLNKRNDLIHTDAFPSRPTNGDLILRVFTNIHPTKTRNWVTTNPFGVLAANYARDAALDEIAAAGASRRGRLLMQSAQVLQRMGLPVVARSAYDRFMLRFHDYLKRNEQFQKNCTKFHFEFPPGSTWLAFTDVVPHSVQSGQYALEQTFIVARSSLASGENAPVSILERICGKALLESPQRERVA